MDRGRTGGGTGKTGSCIGTGGGLLSSYVIPGDTLTEIADSIRRRRDIATAIMPEDMALQVGLIDGLKYETGSLSVSGNQTSVELPLPSAKVLFLLVKTSAKLNSSMSTWLYCRESFSPVSACNTLVLRTNSSGTASAVVESAKNQMVDASKSNITVKTNNTTYYIKGTLNYFAVLED